MKKDKNKIPGVDNSPPIIPKTDQKIQKEVSNKLLKDIEWYFPNEHSTYKELINRWIIPLSFISLLKRRDNHLKKLENPKEKFKDIVQNKIKECEYYLNVIIDRWIEHDFELIDEMKAFKPALRSESDKYIQQDNYEEYYLKRGCTETQLKYIKLCQLTKKYIEQNPKTTDGKEMSVNKAVIIVYKENINKFPNWADSALNSYYYKGENLTISI